MRLAIVPLIYLLALVSGQIDADDPDTVVLTDDSFQDFINQNEYVLVEFYAPWY
jgi:protein disulfide-isomerase A1